MRPIKIVTYLILQFIYKRVTLQNCTVGSAHHGFDPLGLGMWRMHATGDHNIFDYNLKSILSM